MIEEAYYHGQFQDSVLCFSAPIGVNSFGVTWFKTFVGIRIKKTNQENTKIANQGPGFNCGISLEVVGSHQSLA